MKANMNDEPARTARESNCLDKIGLAARKMGKRPLPLNSFRAILWGLSLLSLQSVAQAKTSQPTNPPPAVTLRDFRLVGDLSNDRASFTLNATAVVENKGGSLDLITGT